MMGLSAKSSIRSRCRWGWSRIRILRWLCGFYFIHYYVSRLNLNVTDVMSMKMRMRTPSTTIHNVNQTCTSLNLTMYDPHNIIATLPVDHSKIEKNLAKANCLNFECNDNVDVCNNNNATEYHGETPPCCVHILRDAGRLFDEEMCQIGLDYTAAFGTLLGLIRSDQLIPWTADMDYIIPSKAVANAMVHLWDHNKTGLAHVFQGINRICLTHDFADGKLAKFQTVSRGPNLDTRGSPYIDLYVGRDHPQFPDDFNEIDHCRHTKTDIFPTKRALFYHNTLSQRIPANPEQLLRTYYGENWTHPNPDRSPHGGRLCPYGPTY